MDQLLRLAFFALIVRPLLWLLIGFNVRHRERLPDRGPAIIAANHNSHLDTPVLISLLPLRLLATIRPAAAAGYFLRNRALAWFATRIIGIIPVPLGSGRSRESVLAEVIAALEAGSIVILFPEGTRGEPEQLGRLKTGIATLAERFPEVPVTPVWLYGLGKALPRGEALLVPFHCDVSIGDALYWNGDQIAFMNALEQALRALAAECHSTDWC
jgi:1-acyl-sn-glycerol-3-phosphate acyltransferase